ncbi:hypothetical protein CFIMG_007303RA00001 [Ceratocystis fimbriata CBS 114723]|uniref:DUF7582 domain-containing protein n=1 Tax=Ceratocystis fimbriata CBS 114723 TaxID=1035309 RepID=A0A2C5XFS5_9PEZI|nr:hypothetical protein CFIMG_007303RA00001 [Ceratocystis fimbriata CBS 114723]
MTVTKLRISSPLEAGQSILDACNLPPRLCDALDHASSKLSSKGVSVKLAVALRDYQLPTLTIIPSAYSETGVYASQPPTPDYSPSSTSACYSSTSSRFGSFSNAFFSMRQRLAGHVPLSLSLASTWTSEGTAPSPSHSSAHTPVTPMSPPPMTASTSTTFPSTIDAVSPNGPCALGIRLIQTTKVDAKTARILNHVFNKVRAKFGIGYDMLPRITAPDACGITDTIIRRSISQDEILYGSTGLTLISLDRYYTFKSALSSFSRTGSSTRLEDAVDELRRLYLANGSRKISRCHITRSYDWLSVSDGALAEVDIMYRRAYGGVEGFGAIEGLSHVVGTANSESNFATLGGNMASLQHRFESVGLNSPELTPLDEKIGVESILRSEVSTMDSRWSGSEYSSEINLPSWEEKSEVFHLANDSSFDPSYLKRASTPRPLQLHRGSTPRGTIAGLEELAPETIAASAPVTAPNPKTITTRPVSTTPPPAPTCERPPATILSRTPLPRILTRSLPRLVIPTSNSPENLPKPMDSQPHLSLQTSFPVTSTTTAPILDGHRGFATSGTVVCTADQPRELTETPITPHPDNDGQPPFFTPKAFPPVTEVATDTLSPSSAIATNFYRMPYEVSNFDAKLSLGRHPHVSIAQLLDPVDPRLSMQSSTTGLGLGPITPNGAEDISPVTRGEWGFLFAGPAFVNARTVAVETCHN